MGDIFSLGQRIENMHFFALVNPPSPNPRIELEGVYKLKERHDPRYHVRSFLMLNTLLKKPPIELKNVFSLLPRFEKNRAAPVFCLTGGSLIWGGFTTSDNGFTTSANGFNRYLKTETCN